MANGTGNTGQQAGNSDKKNTVTDEMYKTSVFEEGGNLVVDLQGIQEAKYESVPKGIYDAEIDSVEFGMSNNSGAPMLTLHIMINDGGDYQGRKHRTYWSFSQKALPFTKANIMRVAPELLQGKFVPQRIADEGLLLGKKCRIRITHEDYQGEARSKIDQVMAPATGDQMNAGKAGNGASAKGFF